MRPRFSSFLFSPHLKVTDDASGGNDGVFSRAFGFHTHCEENPFWQCDLKAVFPVCEVRLYNVHCVERARTASVLVSLTGKIGERKTRVIASETFTRFYSGDFRFPMCLHSSTIAIRTKLN